jgi:small neutral amino acid transporter SnatA (MarC family)
VTRFLGETGMNVLTRLMGFILVCIGFQFIVFAVVAVVASPFVVETIRNAYGG